LFEHLSDPAEGSVCTGVHEGGFGRFNEETLGLGPVSIPTLQIVEDTFTKHRQTMSGVIGVAKSRKGIP